MVSSMLFSRNLLGDWFCLFSKENMMRNNFVILVFEKPFWVFNKTKQKLQISFMFEKMKKEEK